MTRLRVHHSAMISRDVVPLRGQADGAAGRNGRRDRSGAGRPQRKCLTCSTPPYLRGERTPTRLGQ